MDVIPILQEVPSPTGRVGIEAAYADDRKLLISATHVGTGDLREVHTLGLVRAVGDDDPLVAHDGGWAGTVDPSTGLTCVRGNLHLVFERRPERIEVTCVGSSVVQVSLAAPPPLVDQARYQQLGDTTGLGEQIRRVQGAGFWSEVLPSEMSALESQPFDTDFGRVRAVSIARWGSCDVVRFVFDEDVQPGGFNVVRQHGKLPPEPGAPLGGSNNHVDIAFAAAR